MSRPKDAHADSAAASTMNARPVSRRGLVSACEVPAAVRTFPLSSCIAVDALRRQINVHACYYHCTVTVDLGLRNLLREVPPGLAFEAWLHGAVLDPSDFNQA